MTVRVRVCLEPIEPLFLGDGRTYDPVRESRQFIAGSVWRGSVAKALLAPGGFWRATRADAVAELPDPLRNIFFGPAAARFGYLYPALVERPGEDWPYTFPLPLTARTCKARRGFRSQGNHGVVDVLVGRLHSKAPEGEVRLHTCLERDCGERLDRFRGMAWCLEPEDAQSYASVSLPRRSFVRVGLNRRTETAEEGILYTITAIAPQSAGNKVVFVGDLYLEERQFGYLKEQLAKHAPDDGSTYRLRVGSARARGFGLSRLHLHLAAEQSLSVAERVRKFQSLLVGEGVAGDELFFSLTLRSPALLLDELGQAPVSLDARVVGPYLGEELSCAEFLPQFSVLEWTELDGWNALWQLPKPLFRALAPGSVLVFKAPAEKEKRIVEGLTALERKGFGERLAEGCGEVVVCDPFHRIFAARNGSGGA